MLENLFSVVLFFSLGYIGRKSKVFYGYSDASDVIIKFIIYFSFPALVIYNVYRTKISPDIIYMVLSGWGVIFFSIFLSFFVGKLLNMNKATLATFVMMSTFGNTSFLGFPFQLAFNGEEGLKYAVIFDQLASFLPVSLLSSFILAYGKETKKTKIDWKKIIFFPPFITLITAFTLKPFISIPEFVMESLHTLGMTVIPLALFAVGYNLRFSSVKNRIKDVSLVLFIKMLLIPVLFVFTLKFLGIPINTIWKSAVVEISMPPMVLASIFVMEAKLDKDLAVSSVGVGIVMSFISVPFIIWILNL